MRNTQPICFQLEMCYLFWLGLIFFLTKNPPGLYETSLQSLPMDKWNSVEKTIDVTELTMRSVQPAVFVKWLTAVFFLSHKHSNLFS